MTSRKCWLLTNSPTPNSFRSAQNRPPSASRDVSSSPQSLPPQLRHTSGEALPAGHPATLGFSGGAVLPTILSPEFFRSSVFGCLDPTQQQTLMQYLFGLPALQQLYAASLQQQQLQQRAALLHDVTSTAAQRLANHQMGNCNKMMSVEENDMKLVSNVKGNRVPVATNRVASEGSKIASEGNKVASEISKVTSEGRKIPSEGSNNASEDMALEVDELAPEVNGKVISEEVNCKTAAELSRQMLSVTALSDFGFMSSSHLFQSCSSPSAQTSTADGDDKIPVAEKSAKKKVMDENQNMHLSELSPSEGKMETSNVDSLAGDAKVTLVNNINLEVRLDIGNLEKNQGTEERESISACGSKSESPKLQSSYDVTDTKTKPMIADTCLNATCNDICDPIKKSPSYQTEQQDDSAESLYSSKTRIKSETIESSLDPNKKLDSTIRFKHSRHFTENREMSEDTSHCNPSGSITTSSASASNGSVLRPYLSLPSAHATLMVRCRFCYASFRSASDRNEHERYLCESAASAVRHLSAAGSLQLHGMRCSWHKLLASGFSHNLSFQVEISKKKLYDDDS